VRTRAWVSIWIVLGGCLLAGGWLARHTLFPSLFIVPTEEVFILTAERKDGRAVIRYGDGTTLEIEGEPQRIVSAAPGITEMIAFLGARDRLVAVSPWCDHPPSVRELPQISVLPFDPEAALAVRPDLLVVDRRLHRRDLDVIRRRVPAVLVLDTSRSLEHLTYAMQVLAVAVGGADAEPRAKAWRERKRLLLRRIQGLEAGTGPARPAPKVLVVGQWDPLYVLGTGSLIDDLVRLCGGRNVAFDLEGDASGVFSEELVLERRPDWILTPREPMPARIAERWRNLPAVKSKQIAPGHEDDLVRAGPRVLDGLERLARVLRGAPAERAK
jgi:iron complex transport system substrate-binding protein